ncbi:MAG: hypothetical protein COA38_08845 [Fluviicola sp.]|nr:MAG: hypothetical protein COA38_08845 [Fluviicola sp.]
MAKIKMTNVKINATNGGTIKNYDSIEYDNVEMNFTNNNIEYITDESVAILDKVKNSIDSHEILELIKTLKLAKPEEQEKIIKKSFFSKFIKGLKDVKPIIELLFKYGPTISENH